MKIDEMNLNEIEERSEQIVAEMSGASEEQLAELREEAKQIAERKKQLKDMETRKKLAEDVAKKNAGETVERAESRKENKMTEAEKRAKEFSENGKVESRAILSTGKIAKPTQVGGISELAEVAAGIVDDVNAIPLTGSGAWVVAYKKADATAADVTDGNEIGGTEADFDYVTINPAEWGTLGAISKQVKKMSPLNYLGAVERSALIALRAKASAKIVAAVIASTLKETKTVALDEKFLRTLALGFKAVPDKGAVALYINRADLITLGDVRGTNEKQALYKITYDQGTTSSGIIEEGGIAVKFRVLDELAAGKQLFGQPGAIDMPMWDGYTIETDEHGEYFKKNQIGVKGIQTANADLVVYHGMQLVKQS